MIKVFISDRYLARSNVDRVLALCQSVLLVALFVFAMNGTLGIVNAHLPANWTAGGWRQGYVLHFVMLLVALGFIGILKPFIGSRFGLCWPKGETYIWPALWVGVLFGLLMLVVDYTPELLHHQAPKGPYGTELTNMVPWLAMQGIFVGISEEI